MAEKKSNILYIDCFSGISGDMFVGAALDLGVKELDAGILLKHLGKIDLKGYEISVSREKKGPLYGTRFEVKAGRGKVSRNFRDIRSLINDSALGVKVKTLALEIFGEIARAESIIHSKPEDEVHFHEVGAVDSIVDIVSASLVMELLDIEVVYGSRVPVGKGVVKTAHGLIPVPAPATLEILRGVPVYGGGFAFEVTTPTGAAIMKVLADRYGEIPDIIINKTGFGAGSRDVKGKASLPDVLRLIYGKTAGAQHPADKPAKAVLISTNIDDSSPEMAGYVIEKLIKASVHDAWLEPVYMKKNRPAFKLCVLCSHERMDEVLKMLFTETSTLGVRLQEITRFTLEREIKKVKLPYGEVNIKTGFLDGKEMICSPEYDSCVELAKKTGKPLKVIYRDALFFYQKDNIS